MPTDTVQQAVKRSFESTMAAATSPESNLLLVHLMHGSTEKATQDKTRQEKTTQEEPIQHNTGQDKTRQEKQRQKSRATATKRKEAGTGGDDTTEAKTKARQAKPAPAETTPQKPRQGQGKPRRDDRDDASKVRCQRTRFNKLSKGLSCPRWPRPLHPSPTCFLCI